MLRDYIVWRQYWMSFRCIMAMCTIMRWYNIIFCIFGSVGTCQDYGEKQSIWKYENQRLHEKNMRKGMEKNQTMCIMIPDRLASSKNEFSVEGVCIVITSRTPTGKRKIQETGIYLNGSWSNPRGHGHMEAWIPPLSTLKGNSVFG